jgi:hypothetical protein
LGGILLQKLLKNPPQSPFFKGGGGKEEVVWISVRGDLGFLGGIWFSMGN